MIEQADIIEIDREYFEIIGKKDFVLVLRSRNTGHFWCLLEQVYGGHRTFRISHRHKSIYPYHVQTNRSSVTECCSYIMKHDAYHMERVRKQKERRMRRLGLIAGKDPKNQPRKGKKKKRRVRPDG